MVKKTFKVNGMTCNSCSNLIEKSLKDKVNSVKASYSKGKVVVDYNEKKISEEKIANIIIDCDFEVEGYGGGEESESGKSVGDRIGFWFMIVSLLVLVYFAYHWIEGFNLSIPGIGESTSLIILFVVGLLTGFHCISMCGAFVLSYTTKNAMKGHKGFNQHLVYGGAKLFSYALIGGIFGLIGGIFAFSVGLRGAIAIFAGLFMIFYALSMMGARFFRKFQVNPKFLTVWTAKATKNAKGFYKAPFITGLLSGLFIACGPLQAMYLYAAGTGSFSSGLVALTAFGIGTLPVMLGFGGMATVISNKTTKKILKISAILVLILGVIMLNRGLTVLGSSYTFDSAVDFVTGSASGNSAVLNGDYQEINMEVDRSGWTPDTFTLKRGVPVKWNIDVKELTGCNNEIIVRDYDIDIKLNKGMNVVEFTPDEAGTVKWSCWMGMIPGTFIVTDDGIASETQVKEAAAANVGGSCGGSCGGSTCGAKTGGSCGCGG